jgi:hypothetical protein
MKSMLIAGAAALSLAGGIAFAQAETVTTTTRTVAPPAVVVAPGAVHVVRPDAVVRSRTTYRGVDGVAQQQTTTRTVGPGPDATTRTTTTTQRY